MTEVQFAKQFLTTLDNKNTKYQSDHVFDPRTFPTRIPYTLPKLSHPPHPLPPKPSATTDPAPGSEPAAPPTINVTLKSTRNPNFTLHLPSLPQTTPINTLKSQIQSFLSGTVAVEKIKILHNKKPIPASKSTIHDVLSPDPNSPPAPGETSVEFGVMVMGGAADPTPQVQTVNLNNEVEAPGPGSENAAVEAVLGVNPEDVAKSPPTADGMEGVERTTGASTQRRGSQPVQPGGLSGKEILGTEEFWDDLQGFLEQRLRDSDEAKRLRGLFENVVRT